MKTTPGYNFVQDEGQEYGDSEVQRFLRSKAPSVFNAMSQHDVRRGSSLLKHALLSRPVTGRYVEAERTLVTAHGTQCSKSAAAGMHT